ncbi:MAG: hypothetical protein QNL62_15065 [Gammaproteobacteria bacterium]|nr:hypothetical protein [Gammaproteobacteria bacterium]
MDAQFPGTSKNNDTNNNKDLANLVYILQAVAVFTALPFIIAVIINYIKRSEVQGTLAESHFRWQIRTFWFSLLWGILGGILILVLIGYVILLCNFFWLIYRILKGWLRLNDNQTMYND